MDNILQDDKIDETTESNVSNIHLIRILPSLSTLIISSPVTPSFTLPQLLEKAFSIIDSDDLLDCYNKSKYSDKILEDSWHFELHRTIRKCLPKGVRVYTEVGKIFTDKGSIDLYIPMYQWGIELLIDGDDLKKHYERFLPGNLFFLFDYFIILNLFVLTFIFQVESIVRFLSARLCLLTSDKQFSCKKYTVVHGMLPQTKLLLALKSKRKPEYLKYMFEDINYQKRIF